MGKFKGRGGPWHYDDELSGVYSESCRFVCDVTDKDNGTLIAAAPELLEVLELILSYHDDGNCVLHKEDVSMARAAINKALGE